MKDNQNPVAVASLSVDNTEENIVQEDKTPIQQMKANGKDSYRWPSLELFSQFNWLVFSEAQNWLFYVYCALFASSSAGGIPLKNLVSKPVRDYKHLLGKDGYLTCHSQNEYHRNSMEKRKEFLKRVS